MIEVIDFESWAGKYFDAGHLAQTNPAMHEPNRGAPKSRLRRLEKMESERLDKWNARRIHAYEAWEAAKIAGLVREPTRLEKLLQQSKGMDDNRPVQAARRILKNYYGIDWETYQMVPDNITSGVGIDFREDKWAFAQKFLSFLTPDQKESIVERYRYYRQYNDHDHAILGVAVREMHLIRDAICAFITQDEDGTAGREYNTTTDIWRTKHNVSTADRELEFAILEAVLEEQKVAQR